MGDLIGYADVMIETRSATILEPPKNLFGHQGRIISRPLSELQPGPKMSPTEMIAIHQSGEGKSVAKPLKYGHGDEGIYARANYEDNA